MKEAVILLSSQASSRRLGRGSARPGRAHLACGHLRGQEVTSLNRALESSVCCALASHSVNGRWGNGCLRVDPKRLKTAAEDDSPGPSPRRRLLLRSNLVQQPHMLRGPKSGREDSFLDAFTPVEAWIRAA
jgi:hypothetical protein